MSGKFQVDREIFENGIWNNVAEFRLFFYILGKAIWRESGVQMGNVLVGRGQYLRSYRNLREDLMYMENNTVKYYGLTTIKRLIDKLVADGRLEKEETELGTLFTVVNYSLYQGFNNLNKEGLEQRRNSNGTATEQQRNNKKKGKKDKKGNKEPIVTSPKFNEETIEYKLADMLYQKILLNDDKTKKPNLYKWAEHIDRLIRIDKRSVEDIKSVINYATSDSFWMSNVLSTNKLRQQFPKLYLKVKEGSNSGRNNSNFKQVKGSIEEVGNDIAKRAGVISL